MAFAALSAGSSMIMMRRLSFLTIKCDGWVSESPLCPTTLSTEYVLNAWVYVQSFWVSVHLLLSHAAPTHKMSATIAPIPAYHNQCIRGRCLVRVAGISSVSWAAGCADLLSGMR